MRIERILANLRALLRANSILADIHARHFFTRSGLTVFAGLIATFGIVMFGIAGYLALQTAWGPIWAAAIIGMASCMLALVLVLIAASLKPRRELDLAREVHKAAVAALIAEGRTLELEFGNLRQGLRLDSVLTGLIVPLAGILIKSLQKRAERPHQSNTR